MPHLLPPSIRDEHYATLDRILEERAEYDLEQLVPLLIDNVDSSALVHLAEWFSILGVEGWNDADTDEKKRDLLKNAILIHRTKATPFSIKESLRRAGFEVKRIEEGTKNFTVPVAPSIKPKYALKYDGTAKFNGAYNYGGNIRSLAPIQYNGRHKFDGSHKYGGTVNTDLASTSKGSVIAWALFRVVLVWNLNNDYTAEVHDSVVAVIEAFQNIRSWLTDVGLETSIAETVSVADEGMRSNVSMAMRDVVGGGVLYDGSAKYDGSRKYSAGVKDALAFGLAMKNEETIPLSDTTSALALGLELTDAMILTDVVNYTITP